MFPEPESELGEIDSDPNDIGTGMDGSGAIEDSKLIGARSLPAEKGTTVSTNSKRFIERFDYVTSYIPGRA